MKIFGAKSLEFKTFFVLLHSYLKEALWISSIKINLEFINPA